MIKIPKKGYTDCARSGIQSSKQVNMIHLKKQLDIPGVSTKEKKPNNNQKNIKNKINNSTLQNLTITEEDKTKLRKNNNFQTISQLMDDGSKKKENKQKYINKEIIKKESKKQNTIFLKPNSKGDHKDKKNYIKKELIGMDHIKKQNLILEDNDYISKIGKINFIKYNNLGEQLNQNSSNKTKEIDINNNEINFASFPSTERKDYISSSISIKDKISNDNIKISKLILNTDRSENKFDILESKNEFDESQKKEAKNIRKTKFPNLSINPFMNKTKRRNIIYPTITIKKISEIQKNINHTDISNSNNISMKSNLNACGTNTLSSISYRKIFSDFPSDCSFSKKTLNSNSITELSDNNNMERIYHNFLLLAKKGDKEKFLKICNQISPGQNKAELNYKDDKGYTALHHACEEGNLKIVEILLKANCDPNIKNNINQTPLHLSAKKGYFDISKILIEYGAKLDFFDSEKNTPLHYACKNNSVELINLFLTKSPIVKEKNNDGKTPKDLATDSAIKSLLNNYIIKQENKLKNNGNNTNRKAIDLNSKKKPIKKIGKKLYTTNTINFKKIEKDINYKSQINSAKKNKFMQNKTIEGIKKIEPNYDKIHISSRKIDENITSKIELNNNTSKMKQKEKSDINIYFQNTNNINKNKNNININIFSISSNQIPQFNSKYKSNRGLIRLDLNDKELSSTERFHHNDYYNGFTNPSLNKTSASINEFAFKGKIENGTVFPSLKAKKRKNLIRYTKNIVISNDSYDEKLNNLNKTEKNIISLPTEKVLENSKDGNVTIKNDAKERNEKVQLSKFIKSTKQLPSKMFQQGETKRKIKSLKNINLIFQDLNKNNIIKMPSSKGNRLYTDYNSINKEKLLHHNPKNNLSKSKNDLVEHKHITLSKFVCLAQLGKGSFGEVFLVKNIDSDEIYAMKILRKERILKQNLLKYAISERNVLSSSHHPFIVKFIFAFQTSSRLFLILEYCPNGDLSKHLMFEKRFKEPRAKFYLCEILLALEDLHKRDIIFRDLKPDNIMLDKEGHCKLTDFGLSKEGVNKNVYAKSFCGSIAYLAPEMLKKEGHGKAVDWYLLGVVFYEMLVGNTPYYTIKKEDIFYNVEFGVLKIPQFISKEASDLLRKLLERNPLKRLGGGARDAEEIKEHPYFKDVDWKKVYEKKIKPPNFVNYTDKMIKYYKEPKLFVNEGKNNQQDNKESFFEGWSFINHETI